MDKTNERYTRQGYISGRLKNFPISFLSIPLGLTGFTLAWQKAEEILGIPFHLSFYLLFISLGISVYVILTYLLKWFKYPESVSNEYKHPVKLNFYPIIAKIFLINSIIFISINHVFSGYFWWIGVVLQFVFSIIIMSSWFRHEKYEIHHINPAWFIPVVGSIIIPISGIHHFSSELSWFFFSLGFFWWMILTIIVINRMIFHHPIPAKLVPTFFILFAPPVIGYIALSKLSGDMQMANMLYYFGLFMFILIAMQYRMFSKLRFYLSWWAYSFPLDAMVIGTLLKYHQTTNIFFKYMSWVLFAGLNMIIVYLFVKTIKAVLKREICVEEEE